MKKNTMLTTIIGLTIITVLLTALWIYSDQNIRSIEEQGSAQGTYSRHYVLVSTEKSDLWNSVYSGASECAKQHGVYLEWIGEGAQTEIDESDALKIAVASHVDGIILNQGSSSDLADLIDRAEEAGIPVITALADNTSSQRTSYVGISGYEMGEFYGQQVLRALHEGENRILILSGSFVGKENTNLNLLYSQMIQSVENRKEEDQTAIFSTQTINTETSFDAEEDIRDILMKTEELPDILICLDLTSTECAVQALIDYNEVGNVTLIGYYASNTVLDAVSKGIMMSSMGINGQEVGQKCIEALEEYYELGNVSEYFNVSPQLIDDSNAVQLLSDLDESGQSSMTEEVNAE